VGVAWIGYLAILIHKTLNGIDKPDSQVLNLLEPVFVVQTQGGEYLVITGTGSMDFFAQVTQPRGEMVLNGRVTIFLGPGDLKLAF